MKTRELLLLTPLFLILSHYLAVFPHEFTHSFFAWALGYKDNPLNIQYGGLSWSNLLLLSNIDEHVDYETIFKTSPFHVALIAFSGPFIANGLMFVLSYGLLQKKYVHDKIYLYYFIFWFNIMNIANLYDYVPIRTFTFVNWDTDMSNLERGLNISPWVVYVIAGYLIFLLLWQLFVRTIVQAYVYLGLNSVWTRVFLLILVVLIIFLYFAQAGLHGYGEISRFVSITSMLICPLIILINWPEREWVKQAMARVAG